MESKTALEPRLYRVREFALLLGLPLPTAYRMVEQELVRSVRLPVSTDSRLGVIRIPAEEVERILLEAHSRGPEGHSRGRLGSAGKGN